MLEQQTTILLASFIAALLPLLMGWLAPAGEPLPGSRWWYLGNLAVAVGLALLGLRAWLPVWLGAHAANTCLLISLILWAQSLRTDLGRGWAMRTVGWACLAALAYYSLTFALLSAPVRTSLNRVLMGMQALYIAHLAWQLARRHTSPTALAMTVCYVMLGLGLISSVWLVLTAPILVDSRGILQRIPGSPALLALMTATISSFCYLGTMLEQSARQKAQALRDRITSDESAKLDARLHDLGRKRRLVLAAGSLAHELNQPLTSALTRTQLAERELRQPEPDVQGLQDLLRKAQTSIRRATDILSRIRSAARAQEPTLASLDLREVAQTACDLVSAECAEQGIELELTLPPLPLWCRGDEVLLSQVLVNLLRNAAQAQKGSHGNSIRVHAGHSGAGLEVSVQDQGRGLDPALLTRWGEPFVGSREDGLGLGLAICRAIAQQHGGQLTLENVPEGGARACLMLPALEAGRP